MAPSVQMLSEDELRPQKKVKTRHVEATMADCFASGLLQSADSYAEAYSLSQPYHHSLIPELFNDTLVRDVRKEIKDNLVFTEKETDIYKVNQTGDLANLDGLEGNELSKLENLSKLRNALYSEDFRTFLRKVTRVGALSGSKIDMSINNYTQGCHLLNHDDVIGTRSVSYILYLPDPDEPWLPEYGGALELYPVKTKGIPEDEPTLILPPSWNQFIMFAVQPGHSFHSVEEVVRAGNERLSISGWFHVAQEGEDGYEADKQTAESEELHAKSTLEQLLASNDEAFTEYEELMSEAQQLSDEDKSVLSKIINPQYLDLRTLVQVNAKFCEDSHIQLSEILSDAVASELKAALVHKDAADGIDGSKMTPHGTGVGTGWRIQGPPHRHRFMVLSDPSTLDADDNDSAPPQTVDPAAALLATIQGTLQSHAFRKWISLVTSLAPVSRHSLARRFRPGLDYTLATSNSKPLIECTISLTPPAAIWEEGQVGGYCCFMAPHEDDEDAAVYKSSSSKRNDDDDEDEDDDGGVLLTTHASWNDMTIVMRDSGILSFTKYVAVRAGGSRWDCTSEFIVAPDDEEEDEDEEDGER